MNPQTIFITGATGFIGRWLVRALAQQGHQMILMLRQPEQQRGELTEWLQQHDVVSPAFDVVQGDLAQADWGLTEVDQQRLAGVDVIYHLATRFAWNLSTRDARLANVESMATLLKLVDRNPGLQRLVWVGGYMVGHPKLQSTLQQLAQGQWQRAYRKLGAYEASKLEGYVVLKAALAQRQVPWTFVHPSTVIGASGNGEISQDIGLLKLLDALHKGRLTAVPGKQDDWLPVVAVDYLAQFLAHVPQHAAADGQEYWVLDDGTPRLTELVGWLAQGIQVPAPRARIPIMVMKWLLQAGLGKRWDMSAESLNFIGSARFDTGPALALAEQMNLPMPHTYATVQKMVAYWRSTQPSFSIRYSCADRRGSPSAGVNLE